MRPKIRTKIGGDWEIFPKISQKVSLIGIRLSYFMCYTYLKTRTNVRILIKNVAVTPCKNWGRWDNRRDLSAAGKMILQAVSHRWQERE